MLGSHAATGHAVSKLDSAVEGALAALSQPLAPGPRHPAAPGWGGGVVNDHTTWADVPWSERVGGAEDRQRLVRYRLLDLVAKLLEVPHV